MGILRAHTGAIGCTGLKYDPFRSMLMDTKMILVLDKSRNDEKILTIEVAGFHLNRFIKLTKQ